MADNFDDTLFGIDGPDLQTGGDGNELIYGHQGDDTIFGGLGNDAIFGGQDNDLVFGNEGNDTLHGNKGDDTIFGGQGNDVVYGNDDHDLVYGNDGDDELWGDYGHNFTMGGAADTLFGGDGDDLVYGNEGDDVLYGDADADTLYGGQDDDMLYGGSGADNLFGNLGSDSMEGGDGADIFQINALDGDGVDYISDLTDDDKIRLAGADLNGTVVSGTTANANEVAVDSADGETTLYIDTDGVDGADVEVVVNGTYTADDFLADGTDIWFDEGVNPSRGIGESTRFDIEYAGWSSSSSLFSLVADDGRDLSEAYVTLSDGTRIDATFDEVSGTWQIDFSGYGEHNPDYDASVNIDPDNPDDPATMNGKGSMSWQDSVQFTLIDEDGNVQNVFEQLLISADRDIKADSEIYGGDGTDVAHLTLLRAYEGDGGESSRYGGGGGTRNLWTGGSDGDKIYLADEASNPGVISYGEWMIASVLNTHIEGQPGIETRVSLGVPSGNVVGTIVLEDSTVEGSVGFYQIVDEETGELLGTVTFRHVNHFADAAGARLKFDYTGNDEDNGFDHYGGSDAFYGLGGNDTVWTDDANGSDYEVTLDGGEGEDMVLFRYVGKDFEFDMNQTADADGYQSLVVNNDDASVNTTFLIKDFEIFGDGNGDDTIIGNDEANIITSKISGSWVGGADSMLGGGGNDSILSGNGADTVHGDGGDDTLYGGNGTDTIYGGDDDDWIYGDAANDWISGGAGNDMLEGGAGDDVFHFEDNDGGGLDFGDDTITDFDATTDSLEFVTAMTDGDLQTATTQDGADVVIDFANGDKITILNAVEADVEGSWTIV